MSARIGANVKSRCRGALYPVSRNSPREPPKATNDSSTFLIISFETHLQPTAKTSENEEGRPTLFTAFLHVLTRTNGLTLGGSGAHLFLLIRDVSSEQVITTLV